MKKYTFEINGKTVTKNVSPEKEQAFLDKYGKYNPQLVEDKTNNLYTNDITQEELHASINSLKESSNGNYDGLIGFVKNFGFKARDDGGYTCFTELTSMGEVLQSLKIPSLSVTSPDFNTERYPGDEADIVIIDTDTTAANVKASNEAVMENKVE